MIDLVKSLIQRNAEIGKSVFEWRKVTGEELQYCSEIKELVQEIRKAGNQVLVVGMTNAKAPDTNFFTCQPVRATPVILKICHKHELQIKIEDGIAVDVFCPKHYAVLRYDKDAAEVIAEI